ncbi:MAG: kynureninase [Candidatus Pelagadaptatus aseana]|uniref:aminotransferase class V-fold PLP-dependent enzyme n=1 Tax=Candidatus Pelagadaptatus aseana TaxID=3120508 RepID=UPI0039B23671
MTSLQDIRQYPNLLSKDYTHAAVAQRIMLTGHIHQALPDVCEQAYHEHWDCLNKYGEERWDEVFARTDRLRRGFANRLEGDAGDIAMASSVHDLFVRFLSALPLHKGGRIVTSDMEHPSISRQLAALTQAMSIELVRVPAMPASDLVERIAAQINDDTLAVCVSSVNFITGQQALELDTLLPLCQKFGAELFVDAYLSVNVQPFSMRDYNLQQAFVVGGGAKYCQMGNGNCFMHVPEGRTFKPVVTGWFGHFDALGQQASTQPLVYPEGARSFDGSTFDALPYFRACLVLDYFKDRELTVDFLADVNYHQMSLIAKAFRELDLPAELIDLPVDVEYMGGFMALTSPHARSLCEKMRDRGVHTDYHGQWLRLGPAPYLCDEQLQDGMIALQESLDEVIRENGL